MNKFFCIFCIISCFLLSPVFSQTSFERGEEFFIQNQPQEALEFLEAAAAEDPDHVQAFLYLGIVNQQLGRIDEAIAVYQEILRRILPSGGIESARIAFNLGNAYLVKGELILAVHSYTQALEVDEGYSAALLNRANTMVQLGFQEFQSSFQESQKYLEDAMEDYERYLSLEPHSTQYTQITLLISYIREEIAAEEQRIQEELAAEEQLRLDILAAEEARRFALEDAARQEAENVQHFIRGVISSLRFTAEDARNFSTVQGHAEEPEIDEEPDI